MKNYKRAYRRYKKYVKFKRRLEKWLSGYKKSDYNEERDLAIKGQAWTFLRHTGRPCNCSSCQYYKYEREPKQKIMKKVWQEILEEERLKKLL